MSNFREFDRETRFLLPPSLDEWLPEQHLARFVVEVIDGLDLSAMVKSYRGTGSAGYHPVLLLGLLVYGYATGVFSSRKLERATYDSVAFRFIAVNQHPDHETIERAHAMALRSIVLTISLASRAATARAASREKCASSTPTSSVKSGATRNTFCLRCCPNSFYETAALLYTSP